MARINKILEGSTRHEWIMIFEVLLLGFFNFFASYLLIIVEIFDDNFNALRVILIPSVAHALVNFSIDNLLKLLKVANVGNERLKMI